jgi:hypothetical protein
MQPIPPPQVKLTAIDIVDLSSDTAASAELEVLDAGTSENTFVGAAMCVVVSRLIPRRFRGGHSRQYFPYGSRENMADEQTWGDTFISGFTTHYEDYTTALSSITWSGGGFSVPVVVSYFHGHTNVLYPSGYYRAIPTARSEPLVDIVEGIRVNKHIGSQRRRNQYVPG